MFHKCSQCEFSSNWASNTRRHFNRKHVEKSEKSDQICEKNNPTCAKNNPTCAKNNPTCAKNNPNCEKNNPNCEKILDKNQCEKCEKILSNNRNYNNHIKVCKGKINKLECIKCKEIFTLPQAKYRHQKSCKFKTSSELILENVNINNQIINNNTNQIINNNTNNQIINNQIINNNTNQIIIEIRNFGDENKEYITNAFLLDCYKNGYYGLIEMIEKIYFNKEHPENHNVRIGSFKNKYFEIHNDNNWIPQGINETLNRMINTAATDIILNVDEENKFKEIDKVIEIQNPDAKKEKYLKETINGKLIARRKVK